MTAVPQLLELYACVAVLVGDCEKGVRLFSAAGAARERMGLPARPSEETLCDGFVSRANDGVDVGRRSALVEEGRAMPPRRALRYARGDS